MLQQAVLDMPPKDVERTAYIKATVLYTMAALNQDMKCLWSAGFKYVLLDEITLIPEFIDSAALFSDIYAAQGMRIVLSGTDSLGFWFALHQELYDRAKASILHLFPIGSTAVCLESTALTSTSAMAEPFGLWN